MMFQTTIAQSPHKESDVCRKAPEAFPWHYRRVLITTESAAASVDAELIRHVFLEADRIPNGQRVYAVEVLRFEETLRTDSGRSPSHESSPASEHSSSGGPDTVVITGPYEPALCNLQPDYLEWLRNLCARSRRIVAVAGGAIYLAALGLLKGRVAVSHWSLHQHLETRYPGTSVRSDILYTQDENIYTCAGALASVDLALRLVEDDRGRAVSTYVAQKLLLPFRRTGVCSQVSSTLLAQDNLSHPISELIAWLPDHLTADLSVSKLARRVAMSPRNFARRFGEQVKMTPARYIEELRFEAAKRELVRRGQSVGGAADSSGFNNVESLRRLFQRRLGTTPKLFRDGMTQSTAPQASS
jgi:transcriptional regulator GlxA family with amidase domain